jgi:hypothetical protein
MVLYFTNSRYYNCLQVDVYTFQTAKVGAAFSIVGVVFSVHQNRRGGGGSFAVSSRWWPNVNFSLTFFYIMVNLNKNLSSRSTEHHMRSTKGIHIIIDAACSKNLEF